MSIRDGILMEFDHEMANTRRLLERVPDDKLAYTPHPKSGTMGWLAAHIAMIPMFVKIMLTTDAFDVTPAEGSVRPPAPTTCEGILALFDAYVAEARSAIAGVSDADFQQPWTLLAGGKEFFTMPKVAVMRGFILSHIYHHRAQLGMYLRLNDIPLPAIYGPTADAPMMAG